MKRIAALILTFIMVLSLASCGAPAAQPSQSESEQKPEKKGFVFTLENYPRMGDSLAALPLGEALTATALDITRAEASDLIVFEGSTSDNYEALMDGTFDIILAYEPSQETKSLIEAYEPGLEFTPIGVDALVFITGKNNKAGNLSQQQIMDIYGGKITNWSEVGGDDLKIDAYVRNKDSGSQTLYDLFFPDTDYEHHIPTDFVVGSMSMLLDAVADYRGTNQALGYTVYYYLTAMESSTLDTSKIMSVDGVMPSNETIASGEYPLTNDFYVVIRKDAKKDSPERILYNWIAGEQGRQIAENEGYVVK